MNPVGVSNPSIQQFAQNNGATNSADDDQEIVPIDNYNAEEVLRHLLGKNKAQRFLGVSGQTSSVFLLVSFKSLRKKCS